MTSQIQEHYTEALKQYENQPNAEARALADLGSAEAAQKKFDKAYLTSRELEQWTTSFENSKKAPIWLFLVQLVFVPLQIYFYIQGAQKALFSAILSFGFATILSAYPFLARFSTLRHYILWGSVIHLIVFPIIIASLYLQSQTIPAMKSTSGYILLGLLGFVAYLAWNFPKTISTWRKLSHRRR